MNKQFRKSIRPVVKLGKKLAVNPTVRFTTGLTPINEHLEEDVFIVGYPKSGNTWFQNLLSGVVHGMNPLYAPGDLIKELVPDIHQKQFYYRFTTPTFFKSHFQPKPDYRRVVYLLRDGRDAMVSYFHYLTVLKGFEPDFAEMVRSGEGILCKWHVHVEAWLENPYNAEIITIRYEDLKKAPVHELRRFCEFMDLERDMKWLELVAENASFEKMHKREKTEQYHIAEPKWPKDKPFTRRGEVGSYKDEMPPEILAMFMEEAQETLKRCGYL